TAWNSGHSTLVTAILSLGNLTVSAAQTSPNPGPAYKMTQDLALAEVRSTVQLGGATVSMRSYTADSDNTFVTELSSPAGSPTVTGTFTLSGGKTVELATVFRSDARQGGGGPSAATLAGRATSAVNAMTTADVTNLRDGHRAFWKNFWLQSFIQTNDATMNAYWYGSLYAMGSASRPGKVQIGRAHV